jgi:hypothetical protein
MQKEGKDGQKQEQVFEPQLNRPRFSIQCHSLNGNGIIYLTGRGKNYRSPDCALLELCGGGNGWRRPTLSLRFDSTLAAAGRVSGRRAPTFRLERRNGLFVIRIAGMEGGRSAGDSDGLRTEGHKLG